MGRKTIPPCILKLLQEQQQQSLNSSQKERCIPPRLLKIRQQEHQKGRCIPPRLLKIQQQEHQKGRYVPPRLLKIQQQEHQQSSTNRARFVPPRILKLQQQHQQQRSMSEKIMMQQSLVSTQRDGREMMEQPMALLEQQEPLSYLQRTWIGVGQSISQDFQEHESKPDHNLDNESTIDYSRLTAFLEQDSSFLTPWNWDGNSNLESKERQRLYFEGNSYFSFKLL